MIDIQSFISKKILQAHLYKYILISIKLRPQVIRDIKFRQSAQVGPLSQHLYLFESPADDGLR